MALKLQRRAETFEAYFVASHHFRLGGIWHLDHSPVELWGWSIWNVYVFGDGHGPCQGGAGSRDEAMEMFARRWRLWLASAGLREVDPAALQEADMVAPALTLRCENKSSEGYRVERNGVLLGVIGRTYGVDTSRWYWSLSSISTPIDAQGMSHPRGGGADPAEALEGLTTLWRAWLATAGLRPE